LFTAPAWGLRAESAEDTHFRSEYSAVYFAGNDLFIAGLCPAPRLEGLMPALLGSPVQIPPYSVAPFEAILLFDAASRHSCLMPTAGERHCADSVLAAGRRLCYRVDYAPLNSTGWLDSSWLRCFTLHRQVADWRAVQLRHLSAEGAV